MFRSFALLGCALVGTLVPAVQADEPQANQPAGQSQLPVIINNSAAARQAPPAGGQNLPTIINLPSGAGGQAPDANRPAGAPAGVRYAVNGVVAPLPCAPIFDCASAYGCCDAPAYGCYAGPGYGYGYGYGLGYAWPAYNAGYTIAYDYWAQPRPLPTAVIRPAGNLSTMPGGNVVSHAGAIIARR